MPGPLEPLPKTSSQFESLLEFSELALLLERTSDGTGDPEKLLPKEFIQSILARLSPVEREMLDRFHVREQSPDQICWDGSLTNTQFRLLKSRAKSHFRDVARQMLQEQANSRSKPEPQAEDSGTSTLAPKGDRSVTLPICCP